MDKNPKHSNNLLSQVGESLAKSSSRLGEGIGFGGKSSSESDSHFFIKKGLIFTQSLSTGLVIYGVGATLIEAALAKNKLASVLYLGSSTLFCASAVFLTVNSLKEKVNTEPVLTFSVGVALYQLGRNLQTVAKKF